MGASLTQDSDFVIGPSGWAGIFPWTRNMGGLADAAAPCGSVTATATQGLLDGWAHTGQGGGTRTGHCIARGTHFSQGKWLEEVNQGHSEKAAAGPQAQRPVRC